MKTILRNDVEIVKCLKFKRINRSSTDMREEEYAFLTGHSGMILQYIISYDDQPERDQPSLRHDSPCAGSPRREKCVQRASNSDPTP